MFIAKQVEMLFQFDSELLFLTEITFDNQPAVIVNTTIATTTHCPIGKMFHPWSNLSIHRSSIDNKSI